MLASTTRRYLNPTTLTTRPFQACITVRTPTERRFHPAPPSLFTTSPQRRKDDAFDPSKTRPENEDAEDVPVSELGNETGKNPADDVANKTRSSQEPAGSKAETGQGGKERDGPSHEGSPKKDGGSGKG